MDASGDPAVLLRRDDAGRYTRVTSVPSGLVRLSDTGHHIFVTGTNGAAEPWPVVGYRRDSSYEVVGKDGVHRIVTVSGTPPIASLAPDTIVNVGHELHLRDKRYPKLDAKGELDERRVWQLVEDPQTGREKAFVVDDLGNWEALSPERPVALHDDKGRLARIAFRGDVLMIESAPHPRSEMAQFVVNTMMVNPAYETISAKPVLGALRRVIENAGPVGREARQRALLTELAAGERHGPLLTAAAVDPEFVAYCQHTGATTDILVHIETMAAYFDRETSGLICCRRRRGSDRVAFRPNDLAFFAYEPNGEIRPATRAEVAADLNSDGVGEAPPFDPTRIKTADAIVIERRGTNRVIIVRSGSEKHVIALETPARPVPGLPSLDELQKILMQMPLEALRGLSVFEMAEKPPPELPGAIALSSNYEPHITLVASTKPADRVSDVRHELRHVMVQRNPYVRRKTMEAAWLDGRPATGIYVESNERQDAAPLDPVFVPYGAKYSYDFDATVYEELMPGRPYASAERPNMARLTSATHNPDGRISNPTLFYRLGGDTQLALVWLSGLISQWQRSRQDNTSVR